MDATQLSLLLGSRSFSSVKPAQQSGDDLVGNDDAFAMLLRQQQSDRAKLETSAELDRQGRRYQTKTAVHDPVASAATGSELRESTRAINHAANAIAKKHPKDAASTSSAGQQSPKSEAAASQPDNAGVKPTIRGRATKNDATTGSDGTADQAAVGATTAITITPTQDAGVTPEAAQSGSTKSSDAASTDGSHNQSPAPQGEATTAAAASAAGIIAGSISLLGIGQPASSPNDIDTVPQAGTPLPLGAMGQPADGKPSDGNQQDQQVIAADQNAMTNAEKAIVALVPPTPGQASDTPATGKTPNQSAMSSSTTALPQSVTTPAPASSEAAPGLAFANLVAKNSESSSAGSDNLRVSVSKAGEDKAPQLPRPLVRIEDSHQAQIAAQPTTSAAQPATLAADDNQAAHQTTNGFQTNAGDSLHAFMPLSPLATAAGTLAANRQPDFVAALRQQLANASVQDQVAVHLQRAVRDSVDKISIQLSPAELGRIHVKMDINEDKQVSATITVERPSTLDLLQRDTKALERALQEAGLKADSGSLSFSLQRGNQGDSNNSQGWGQSGGRQTGSSGQEKAADAAEMFASTAGNEIDTANGLVNVAI